MIEYTVQKGDTLTGLALRFLGDASRFMEIFHDNAQVISAAQRLRGGYSSGPSWIFPGIKLRIRTARKANPSDDPDWTFALGDEVYKAKGYKWPGIIIMRGRNLAGQERYVVECIVPEVAGALHIYSPGDLKKSG